MCKNWRLNIDFKLRAAKGFEPGSLKHNADTITLAQPRICEPSSVKLLWCCRARVKEKSKQILHYLLFVLFFGSENQYFIDNREKSFFFKATKLESDAEATNSQLSDKTRSLTFEEVKELITKVIRRAVQIFHLWSPALVFITGDDRDTG